MPRKQKLSVGAVSMIWLTAYLFCGATAPATCNTQNTRIGPSGGQVAGVLVGTAAILAVGTVVLVEVHKSHHTVKGCVSTGPEGIEVTTEGDKSRTYRLEGATTGVKVGDLVQFHGDKVRKTKDNTGDQTFQVQNINRDYGPCKVVPVLAAKQ